MKRIGIVCEGPTDFVALSEFLAESLRHKGIDVEFVDVQPNLDATSLASGGGWPNALVWLDNNPLASRLSAYLGQGLFASGLSSKRCDYLIVQIDTDVLDEDDFTNFVRKRKGIAVATPVGPGDRYDEVQRVLLSFCELANLAEADENKHIVAPAVENTEAWCISVCDPDLPGVELLKKGALATEFASRLSSYEASNPKPGSIKNVERRRDYCKHHKGHFARLEAACSQYARLVLELERVTGL